MGHIRDEKKGFLVREHNTRDSVQKNMNWIGATLFTLISISACSEQHPSIPAVEEAKTTQESEQLFTVQDALGNLTYAKDQYLKMASHIEAERHLYYRPACVEDTSMICVPRSYEHGGIFMDKYELKNK